MPEPPAQPPEFTEFAWAIGRSRARSPLNPDGTPVYVCAVKGCSKAAEGPNAGCAECVVLALRKYGRI